eukprot:Sspe_Gene.19605::Locus_7154_Transcript_2_2_Confidence_0.667_Length_1543::g.19605::m.19605
MVFESVTQWKRRQARLKPPAGEVVHPLGQLPKPSPVKQPGLFQLQEALQMERERSAPVPCTESAPLQKCPPCLPADDVMLLQDMSTEPRDAERSAAEAEGSQEERKDEEERMDEEEAKDEEDKVLDGDREEKADEEAAKDEESHDDDHMYVMVPSSVPMDYGCMSSLSSQLVVRGIRIGGWAGMTIGKSVCNKVLGTMALASHYEIPAMAARSAASLTAVQLEATRQIILRIPYVGSNFVNTFMKGIGTSQLDCVAADGILRNVTNFGLRGQMLMMTSYLLLNEMAEVVWLLQGSSSLSDMMSRSTCNVAVAMGSIAGGVAGTAIGTLIFPGVGTGIGSLAGAFLGASFAEAAAKQALLVKGQEGEFLLLEEAPLDGEQVGYVELVLEERVKDEPNREITIECELSEEDRKELQEAELKHEEQTERIAQEYDMVCHSDLTEE